MMLWMLWMVSWEMMVMAGGGVVVANLVTRVSNGMAGGADLIL